MKAIALTAALILLLQCPAFAAPLDVDDFLPPVQASDDGAKNDALAIRQPQSVRTEEGFDGKPAIAAPDAQDAINAAVKNIPAGDGCEQIRFPSGFGWVSSGTSTYKAMPNKAASLTAQRLAYQKAYLQARNNLARTLYGLSTAGKTKLASEIVTLTSDTDSMVNASDLTSESVTEKVNGMLRGYVLYDLKDEQKDSYGVVTVTIVATPKTMNAAARVDSNGISADSVRDGVKEVLAELSSSLLPPVGGKTILARTGELAYVGFGSAIVKENPDPALSARLALDAQKMAAMRARSALCGIIIGDDISSATTLDSATSELNAQFEKEEKKDIVFWKSKDPAQVRKLEEQKNAFLNAETFREEISSVRRGVLPPGIAVKTFFNEDKSIVTGVAVYMPSLSMGAEKFRKAMGDARILQPLDGSQPEGSGGQPRMPRQGPSGKVQQDADL